MKVYETLKIKDMPNNRFVMSTCYKSPIGFLFEIQEQLKNEGFRGCVLVDALLSNGFASNRFMSMNFDGKAFEKATIRVIDKKDIPVNMLRMAYEFYFAHPEYVEQSSLSDVQKQQLKTGLLLKKIK